MDKLRFLFFAATVFLLSGCPSVGEWSVYTAARDEIETLLRAPSTAKWPSPSERLDHVHARPVPQDKLTELSEELGHDRKRWIVLSWVDSENGFGAMSRSYWAVAVANRVSGGYMTRVIDISDERMWLQDVLDSADSSFLTGEMTHDN
ncbi:MAG: hypothetical protein ACOC2N_01680 [Spirochaetota bacterium]